MKLARLFWLSIIAVCFGLRGDRAAIAVEPVTTIVDCSVFDPTTEKMLPNRTVVIHGPRIQAILSADQIDKLPAGATRIDGRGKFAIPGLIDAHVHVVHVNDFARVTGDETLPLYLAAGVTSVRSTGDEVVAETLVARFAERHPESSPRVFTCSPLLDGDPPIHRDIGRAVTDVAKIPEMLNDFERWNIKTLKIYAGTGRTIGKAIIEEGHRRGFIVTAHLGGYRAQDAVADGVDCLEHIWSVYNYIIPPDVKREPGYRGRLDLNTPICNELIAELVKRKTFVDPTLAVFRNMILLPDEQHIREHPDNALAPKRLRDFWPIYLARTGCPQGGQLGDRRREFAKFQELTGKLYKAGVPLLAGTDAPEPQVTPGFSLHQELEMLVESGLPPSAALRAATLHNAMALRQEKNLGDLSAGKWADIVLLTANPLDDIRNTRKIDVVFRGGIVTKPAEVLKLVPKD